MRFVVLTAVIMKIIVKPRSLADRHNVSEESAVSIFVTEEGSKRAVSE
jgi:hypothetical protein